MQHLKELIHHWSQTRAYLTLVVVIQGSESPPSRALRGELDHSRCEHETEEQPTNQPQCQPIVRLRRWSVYMRADQRTPTSKCHSAVAGLPLLISHSQAHSHSPIMLCETVFSYEQRLHLTKDVRRLRGTLARALSWYCALSFPLAPIKKQMEKPWPWWRHMVSLGGKELKSLTNDLLQTSYILLPLHEYVLPTLQWLWQF